MATRGSTPGVLGFGSRGCRGDDRFTSANLLVVGRSLSGAVVGTVSTTRQVTYRLIRIPPGKHRPLKYGGFSMLIFYQKGVFNSSC